MRSLPRIFASILMAALVATAPLATGCRHRDRDYDDQSYRQWEQDTHREHREVNQRSDEEKREYRDYRNTHQRQ